MPTQAVLAQLKQQCQGFGAFAALTGVSILGGALHRARVMRDDAQGFEGDATQLELGSGYDSPSPSPTGGRSAPLLVVARCR